MQPFPLNEEQRSVAWRRFEAFALLNGFSFAILGESILVLYALKAGVSEPATAVMGSFLFLTMPFMLVGKQLMKRIGAARTQGMGWLFRNGFGLVMAAAPLASWAGQPGLVAPIFLFGALGFYACRGVGMVGFRPLIGEVTREGERGRFMGRFGMRINISYLSALLLLAAIMQWQPSLGAFQVLLVVACVAGIGSAGFMLAMPEGPGPAQSAATPLVTSMKSIAGSPRLRRMVAAQMAGWAMVAMIIPISAVALKRGYNVSEAKASLFVFVQISGSLLASYAGGILSGRTGPRPMVGVGALGLLAVAVLWAVTPQSFLPLYTFLVFLVLGMGKAWLDLGTLHYFMNATDEKDRVDVGIAVMVLGGAAAGVVGAVVSGGVLKILKTMALTPVVMYRTYFAAAAVCSLPLFWTTLRLQPLGDWKVRSMLALLASPRNLYTQLQTSRRRERGE